MLGGLGGLAQGAAAFGMLSDRRLKKDIERIGSINGLNVYSWNYVWGEPAVGFMADEVPWAVAGQIGGYDYVDLGRVL